MAGALAPAGPMAATLVGGRVYLGEIPLAIRPWRGLQAAASRLVSMPCACDHWLADDWELERLPAYIETRHTYFMPSSERSFHTISSDLGRH